MHLCTDHRYKCILYLLCTGEVHSTFLLSQQCTYSTYTNTVTHSFLCNLMARPITESSRDMRLFPPHVQIHNKIAQSDDVDIQNMKSKWCWPLAKNAFNGHVVVVNWQLVDQAKSHYHGCAFSNVIFYKVSLHVNIASDSSSLWERVLECRALVRLNDTDLNRWKHDSQVTLTASESACSSPVTRFYSVQLCSAFHSLAAAHTKAPPHRNTIVLLKPFQK